MRAVVFTLNSARILDNPLQLSSMVQWPNAVIDPDLSHVEDVLPQFWKLDNGSIVPMTPKEVRYRKRVIERNGMDNHIRRLDLHEIQPEFKDYEVILALDKEYNQLRSINYVYLAAQILCLMLLVLILMKK